MRDEVQATDVLRVGRMYEDLFAGGEAAKAVLIGLAKGPLGDDEESQSPLLPSADDPKLNDVDDHVHHLIHLLDQSEPETEPQPEAEPAGEADVRLDVQPEDHFEATAEVFETRQHDAEPLDQATPPVSRTQSDTSMPNGHVEEKPVSSGMLNFLQEDELAEPGIEDGYEVVPMLEPHQVSSPTRKHRYMLNLHFRRLAFNRLSKKNLPHQLRRPILPLRLHKVRPLRLSPPRLAIETGRKLMMKRMTSQSLPRLRRLQLRQKWMEKL